MMHSKILHHIARFITIANGYQDDEEERLSYAFVTLTKYHLQESEITNWLLELHQLLVDKQAKGQWRITTVLCATCI